MRSAREQSHVMTMRAGVTEGGRGKMDARAEAEMHVKIARGASHVGSASGIRKSAAVVEEQEPD